MSPRSRARHLQRSTGLTYQQALAKIRANAEAAAALARERDWPLGRADLVLAGRHAARARRRRPWRRSRRGPRLGRPTETAQVSPQGRSPPAPRRSITRYAQNSAPYAIA